MEGNKMSTEEVAKVGHQEGPSWKTVGRFPTFEEADQKRLELVMEEDLQVKVHWQGKANHRYYAVKTREDPSIALAAALNAKREEKKRRKAKLNKKRRKK
jgi:CelD/BcsL family acetyltransferase involved in cellulose biosynthesis